MEPLRIEADLIRRATAGDAGAAGELLALLVTGSAAEKLDTTRALAEVREARFWELMLEFLAEGRWNGTVVDKADRRVGRARIVALFAPVGGDTGTPFREEALRKAIVGGSERVSVVAIEIAAQVQGTVVALIEAVNRGSRQQRLEAIRTLGLLHDPRAVPVLMGIVSQPDEVAAGLAKDALVEIGGPAVESLVKAWEDQTASGQVRWMAARALARIHDPRSIPTLVGHLNDPEYELRWLAADGLIVQQRAGIKATLEAVAVQYMTSGMADAAAHVLLCASEPAVRDLLKPVVEALRSLDFAWAASEPAEDALNALTARGLI